MSQELWAFQQVKFPMRDAIRVDKCACCTSRKNFTFYMLKFRRPVAPPVETNVVPVLEKKSQLFGISASIWKLVVVKKWNEIGIWNKLPTKSCDQCINELMYHSIYVCRTFDCLFVLRSLFVMVIKFDILTILHLVKVNRWKIARRDALTFVRFNGHNHFFDNNVNKWSLDDFKRLCIWLVHS